VLRDTVTYQKAMIEVMEQDKKRIMMAVSREHPVLYHNLQQEDYIGADLVQKKVMVEIAHQRQKDT
jgi:hypothetical protein